MFVIELIYKASLEEIDAHMAAHDIQSRIESS
jgi:hypothetical protein